MNPNIEYIDLKRGMIAVYLGDGTKRRKRKVGVIHERDGKSTKAGPGWQYAPNGTKNGGGEVFPSLALCKQSLEAA